MTTAVRRLLLVSGILTLVALLILFALYNEGNPIVLEFGLGRWRGEAVYALYGAVFLGLLVMYLIGLPADLAARRERRRLERRVRDLARRSEEASRPAEPDDDGREAVEEEPAPEASR